MFVLFGLARGFILSTPLNGEMLSYMCFKLHQQAELHQSAPCALKWDGMANVDEMLLMMIVNDIHICNKNVFDRK